MNWGHVSGSTSSGKVFLSYRGGLCVDKLRYEKRKLGIVHDGFANVQALVNMYASGRRYVFRRRLSYCGLGLFGMNGSDWCHLQEGSGIREDKVRWEALAGADFGHQRVSTLGAQGAQIRDSCKRSFLFELSRFGRDPLSASEGDVELLRQSSDPDLPGYKVTCHSGGPSAQESANANEKLALAMLAALKLEGPGSNNPARVKRCCIDVNVEVNDALVESAEAWAAEYMSERRERSTSSLHSILLEKRDGYLYVKRSDMVVACEHVVKMDTN